MRKCQCCGCAYETTAWVAGYCPTCLRSQDVIDSHINGNHDPKNDPTTDCAYCLNERGVHVVCMHEFAEVK